MGRGADILGKLVDFEGTQEPTRTSAEVRGRYVSYDNGSYYCIKAVGAILMSLSTVIVAINSQTLRKYEPRSEKPKMEMQNSRNEMEHMHHS